MCPKIALEKFKIRVCQGVSGGTKTPFLAIFAYFLIFFVFFFSFPHSNHFIFGLQLVQSILVHMCRVVSLEKFKSGSVRGYQGYENPIFSHFCLFFEIFCLFLQFSTLESCYIWFTISLEYSSAYVYSNCPGKIRNQGLSGGIRGYKTPFLSHFCLFF